jgi:hypothetical protein
MVQKGKVEETILESVPQLTIQLINAWMLDELGMMQPLAIFSIALSVFSLSNTVWYYGYWNLFRCMSIRDVPCALALYNYKLHGVSDGELSFSISMQKIKISPVEMSSVGVKVVDLENDSASCTGHAPDYAAARTEESANDQDVTSDGGAVAAAVAKAMKAKVDEISRLKQEKDDEISRLKQQKQEKDEEISRLKQEKDDEISRLKQQKQEKDDEISRLKQKHQDMEKQLQISDGRPALAGEDEV